MSEGLAAALVRTAAELGLEIGQVEPVPSEHVAVARIPSPRPERPDVTITGYRHRRMFRFENGESGTACARGHTGDLSEIVKAAAAWFGGADPRGMKAAADFIGLPELAEARAVSSAAGMVDAAWRGKINAWRAQHIFHPEGWQEPPILRALQDLLDAAYREPLLNRLFPVTSHYILWFSRCAEHPYVRVGIAIEPLPDGRYLIRQKGVELGFADTTAEAVAIAVANLPPGIGPAVLTAADVEG